MSYISSQMKYINYQNRFQQVMKFFHQDETRNFYI